MVYQFFYLLAERRSNQEFYILLMKFRNPSKKEQKKQNQNDAFLRLDLLQQKIYKSIRFPHFTEAIDKELSTLPDWEIHQDHLLLFSDKVEQLVNSLDSSLTVVNLLKKSLQLIGFQSFSARVKILYLLSLHDQYLSKMEKLELLSEAIRLFDYRMDKFKPVSESYECHIDRICLQFCKMVREESQFIRVLKMGINYVKSHIKKDTRFFNRLSSQTQADENHFLPQNMKQKNKKTQQHELRSVKKKFQCDRVFKALVLLQFYSLGWRKSQEAANKIFYQNQFTKLHNLLKDLQLDQDISQTVQMISSLYYFDPLSNKDILHAKSFQKKANLAKLKAGANFRNCQTIQLCVSRSIDKENKTPNQHRKMPQFKFVRKKTHVDKINESYLSSIPFQPSTPDNSLRNSSNDDLIIKQKVNEFLDEFITVIQQKQLNLKQKNNFKHKRVSLNLDQQSEVDQNAKKNSQKSLIKSIASLSEDKNYQSVKYLRKMQVLKGKVSRFCEEGEQQVADESFVNTHSFFENGQSMEKENSKSVMLESSEAFQMEGLVEKQSEILEIKNEQMPEIQKQKPNHIMLEQPEGQEKDKEEEMMGLVFWFYEQMSQQIMNNIEVEMQTSRLLEVIYLNFSKKIATSNLVKEYNPLSDLKTEEGIRKNQIGLICATKKEVSQQMINDEINQEDDSQDSGQSQNNVISCIDSAHSSCINSSNTITDRERGKRDSLNFNSLKDAQKFNISVIDPSKTERMYESYLFQSKTMKSKLQFSSNTKMLDDNTSILASDRHKKQTESCFGLSPLSKENINKEHLGAEGAKCSLIYPFVINGMTFQLQQKKLLEGGVSLYQMFVVGYLGANLTQPLLLLPYHFLQSLEGIGNVIKKGGDFIRVSFSKKNYTYEGLSGGKKIKKNDNIILKQLKEKLFNTTINRIFITGLWSSIKNGKLQLSNHSQNLILTWQLYERIKHNKKVDIHIRLLPQKKHFQTQTRNSVEASLPTKIKFHPKTSFGKLPYIQFFDVPCEQIFFFEHNIDLIIGIKTSIKGKGNIKVDECLQLAEILSLCPSD